MAFVRGDCGVELLVLRLGGKRFVGNEQLRGVGLRGAESQCRNDPRRCKEASDK